MKRYKCIFSKDDHEKRFLIQGAKIDLFTPPIEFSEKEEEASEENIYKYSKKRSEVVEEDDTEEEKVYQFFDGDNRTFSSKKMTVSNNYFAFINMGDHLKVVTIEEWHKFNQCNFYNEIADTVVLDEVNTREKDEEVEEIDYVDKFDDDNSEDEIQIQPEFKLSKAGRKMKKLMRTYEENVEVDYLSSEELRKFIGKENISIKTFIELIKNKIGIIDQKSKEIIRVFVKQECEMTNGPDGKLIKLLSN